MYQYDSQGILDPENTRVIYNQTSVNMKQVNKIQYPNEQGDTKKPKKFV